MNKKLSKSKETTDLITLFSLFIVIAIGLYIIIGKSMYSGARLTLMGYQIPEFGLISIGMMFSFLMGGIDLSLVANANLAGILCAYVLSGAWFSNLSPAMAIFVGVIIALVSAVIAGILNGILVAKFSVPPMIATLSTMTLYTGIAMALTGGDSVMGFPEAFNAFGIATICGVPIIFIIFLVIVVIVGLFLSQTTTGRKIYLYGANPVASRFSAIDNERLVITVFAVNGLLAGLAGIIIISRVTTAKVGYGDAYLTQAMLIAIIGGVSPNGGKGNIFCVMIAIIIIQFLSSAFTIWQLSPYNRKLIWGALLILVILLNYLTDYLKRRKSNIQVA